MGRYAFFSSGLEYKFAFSVQESSDITLFGGEYLELENGKHTMAWDATFDSSVCEGALEELEAFHGYTRPDLSQYERSLKGAHTLKLVCYEKEFRPTYTLGLLIAHQLRYNVELTASFEA